MFGFGFVFGYATSYGDLMLAVWLMILIVAQTVSRYMFFSAAEREAAPWSIALQFCGLAYVLTFGFAWVFRNRIISSLPAATRSTDLRPLS